MAVGTKKHFVKKARRDIWMKDEDGQEDTILIAKGESYWWWKFRYKPKMVSKTEPTDKQLDSGYRNEYNDNMSRFQSDLEEVNNEETKEELRGEVEEYRDTLQERLDSMPEQLQESSVLNERIEELDNLLTEIEDKEVEDED